MKRESEASIGSAAMRADDCGRRVFLTGLVSAGATVTGCAERSDATGTDPSGSTETTPSGAGTRMSTPTAGEPEPTASTPASERYGGTVKIGVVAVLGEGSPGKKTFVHPILRGFYAGLVDGTETGPLTGATRRGTYTVRAGRTTYELFVRDATVNQPSRRTDHTTWENAVWYAGDLTRGSGRGPNVDVLYGFPYTAWKVTRPPESSRGLEPLSGTPLIVASPNVATTADSRFCRKKLFRTTETWAMMTRAATAYVDEATDTERVALLGRPHGEIRDPVSGHVLQARSFLSARNTSIASERTLSLETIREKNRNEGWTSVLDRIESAGADALLVEPLIVNLAPPRILTDFLRGGYSFRFVSVWPRHGQVVRVGEAIESVLGASVDAAHLANRNLGPFVSRYHWNQYEGTTARSFVETFTDTYGRVPDTRSSAAFAAGRALDMAVQTARSTDGEELAAALRGASIARTPKGTDGYTFQRYNNQARSSMTLAPPVPTTDDIEGWDAAVMPGEPVATVPAKTAALPPDSDLMNCSL